MFRRAGSSSAKIQEEITVDLTPMIDVTFQLLIFFMLTLKFRTLEGKLESLLPPDRGFASRMRAVQIEDAEIVLKVIDEDQDKPAGERRVRYFRRNGSTPFGISTPQWDEAKNSFRCEPPNTLDLISEYLASVHRTTPESRARINAWPDVPNDRVVELLDRMVRAGFNDVSWTGIPRSLIGDLASGRISNGGR